MTAVRLFAFTAMACCAFLIFPTAGYGVGQSYTGGTYVEDFNSPKLSSTDGSSNPWTDFANPIPGWALRFAGNQGTFPTVPENQTRDAGNSAQNGNWLASANYLTNSGAIGTPGFYSYGSATGIANSDRALGTFENNPNGNVTGGDREILLILANDSPTTYTSFSLAYDGEQWRGTAGLVDSLVFDYTITNANSVITEGNYTIGWTAVTALNFSSPRFNLSTGINLDGNAAINRVAGIHATVTGISWQPSQWLTMRWWSNNNVGADQGLAIDNLVFSAPEPGGCQLMLLGMPVLRRWLRRR